MRRYILFALLWASVCGIVFIPARWAATLLPDSAKVNIVPQSISGTLWNGQAKILLPKTSWPMSATYKAHAGAALFGRPYAKMQLSGTGFTARGNAGIWGQNNIRLKDSTAEFSIAQLPVGDPRFAGLLGQVFLTLDDLNIKNGCKAASGQARTNVLTANKTRWQWTGPPLSGPISCDNDAVLAALRGSDADYNVAINLRIYPDGIYGVDVTVNPKGTPPPELGIVLGLLGFETDADGRSQLKEKGQIFQGTRGQT